MVSTLPKPLISLEWRFLTLEDSVKAEYKGISTEGLQNSLISWPVLEV